MQQVINGTSGEVQTKKYVANLFKVLTHLPPRAAMKLYGELLTEDEAVKLVKRLEIGVSLLEGESYRSLQQRLHVTPNTVAEIGRVIKESGEGFRTAHELFL